MNTIHYYNHPGEIVLESGEILRNLIIAYSVQGNFVPGKSKVIWVCHALTANAEVSVWWPGLFGTSAYFDQENSVVICANILGSCYGTSGPLSLKANGEIFGFEFPQISVRDMANAHELLRQQIGIEEIDLLIGASLGGQQAQEFAWILKTKLKQLILIASNAAHSAFGKAFNEAQRLALLADPTLRDKTPEAGRQGLIAARSIAMLSYRSYEGYALSQTDEDESQTDDFKASNYQRYQGEKLAKRFHAASYWVLSKAMDAHHIGRERGGAIKALAEIKARTLVIGISSDLLFPLEEQRFLAKHVPNAEFYAMHSNYGHDGFLVETEQLERLFDDFLYNQFKGFKPTTFKQVANYNQHNQ